MASSIPLQVAETIQTVHINKDPSAEHDINPSTATSKREPVILEKQGTQPSEQQLPTQEDEVGESSTQPTSTKTSKQQQQHPTLFQQSLHSHSRTITTPGDFGEEEEDMDDEIDIDEDEDDQEEEGHIPFSILRAKPRGAGAGGVSRKHHLPPIPDLRYEQSYLHSIRDADTWWKVVLITARDQVMMPFAQGILYNLAICGWQFWNRNARVHGSSVGARLRRWWYGVNNWPIPPAPAGAPSRSSVFKSNFSNSRFGK